MRQENRRPITVGINSNGGSVAVMEKLISLLTGPDQDGHEGRFIAVVIDHAYSAAATMLARASYAVALPHTEILCHDVRYGGLEDVTPDYALTAAKNLQVSNERASQRLAESMFRRWMWAYLDVNKILDKVKISEPEAAKSIGGALEVCSIPTSTSESKIKFDLHGFIVWIFSRLRPNNEVLVNNATKKLWQWGVMMGGATHTPQYRDDEAGVPGMLDGARHVFRELTDKTDAPLGSPAFESDLNLFLLVVTSTLYWDQNRPPSVIFEAALRDYSVIKSIDDPKHRDEALHKILSHKHVFFAIETATTWDNLSKEEKKEFIELAGPVVKTAWLFCVLIARELFTGEHLLNPVEALSLGLVDEIAGDSRLESRRRFQQQKHERQEKDTRDNRKNKLSISRHQSAGANRPFWRVKSEVDL
jgi:ATP-dependent protease ClpP protease subunit